MKRSFTRRLVHSVIAISIPIAVFVGFEIALRMAGVGQHIPLFVAASNAGYLMPNPELVRRYVHYGGYVPAVSPDTYYFPRTKPHDTLRLVVMGGSTAAGFPYGRFGSPAGLLQQQMQARYPDLRIEVISVAMSSVNSYTLRDIADEVAEIKPDAVLIYAGHNEYLGLMGAGASSAGHLSNLAFLALKDSRIFQLLQRLLAPDATDNASSADAASGRSVMATLAAGNAIEFGSAAYQAGLNQFQDNMRATLSTFTERQIPVVLSTLVANEKDQPPFQSLPAPVGTAMPDTLATLQAQVARYPKAASAHYALAQALLSEDPDAAHQHFVAAMDQDLLRFRAPSAFNPILRRLAQQSGVYLSDSERALRRDAGTPSIGKQHMLEHLHPNERGYFIIATTFAATLEDTGILPVPKVSMTRQRAWRQRPLTAVDSELASLKITSLTSDYPFRATPQPVTLPAPRSELQAMAINRYKGEAWLAQQPALLQYFQRNQQWHEAATVATTLATALPFESDAAHVASQLSLRAGRIAEAIYFARQAVALDERNLLPQLTLAEALFKFDRKTQAISALERAQAAFPDDPRPPLYLSRLRALH